MSSARCKVCQCHMCKQVPGVALDSAGIQVFPLRQCNNGASANHTPFWEMYMNMAGMHVTAQNSNTHTQRFAIVEP